MPERSFSISAPAADLTPDAQGRTIASVTVTSTAPAAVRAQTRVTPLDGTPAGWFTLAEPERDFNPAETHQFAVSVKVPPGTAPGRYPFRVDVCNTANSDDDYTEGPQFALNIAAPPPPDQKPPSRLWILFLIIGLVVIGGITTVVVMLNRKAEPEEVPAAMVKVPDAVGIRFDQLQQLIGATSPIIVVSQAEPFFVAEDRFVENSVTKQEPAFPGEMAQGSELKVWLQPPWSRVPAVSASRDLVQTAKAVTDAGFLVKLDNRFTERADDADKVADTLPASGTGLPRGQTVTIRVWKLRAQPSHNPAISRLVIEYQPPVIRFPTPRRLDLRLRNP